MSLPVPLPTASQQMSFPKSQFLDLAKELPKLPAPAVLPHDDVGGYLHKTGWVNTRTEILTENLILELLNPEVKDDETSIPKICEEYFHSVSMQVRSNAYER